MLFFTCILYAESSSINPELGNKFCFRFFNLDKKNRITFSKNVPLLAVHCDNIKSWSFADLLYTLFII